MTPAEPAFRCPPTEHHWVSSNVPTSDLVPWVIACSMCGAFNGPEMDRHVRARLQREALAELQPNSNSELKLEQRDEPATHEYKPPMWSDGDTERDHVTACVYFIQGATPREDRVCYQRSDHPVHHQREPVQGHEPAETYPAADGHAYRDWPPCCREPKWRHQQRADHQGDDRA